MTLGHFSSPEEFRIHGVTGPDEYTAIVDDNVYTNLMAQRNLREAVNACVRRSQVAAELEVSADELYRWRVAAEAMYIPYDQELGVHPQSEGFTRHGEWNFEATAPDGYPLLLHVPYFQLYRKQLIKQADLVLALHLRGDAFTPEEKARNFAYYEARTVRDSSLSAATQARSARVTRASSSSSMVSTCHARWYSPRPPRGRGGWAPTPNSPRSWWFPERGSRRNAAFARGSRTITVIANALE